jgi:hypothetical protein
MVWRVVVGHLHFKYLRFAHKKVACLFTKWDWLHVTRVTLWHLSPEQSDLPEHLILGGNKFRCWQGCCHLNLHIIKFASDSLHKS